MGMRVPGSNLEPYVNKLVELEKLPVEKAKQRREQTVGEKKEVEKLQTMLADLDAACNAVKTKGDFYKLKVDSSHPDILEGQITGIAELGTYEFEVRALSRIEKELAYGFPDKDQTPVGFGYMLIEREDEEPLDVTIEPGSTLQDVARQINDMEAGVRAMVINTKYKPDSFRLLVISQKSGAEARIEIDEDTTFLEFKEQVTGRNLDVLFEDVPVTSENNVLDELVDGVNFRAKRAEPGTRVQMSITHDLEATVESIKAFVDKYNEIVRFSNEQSRSPAEGEPGRLSGDGSVKSIMRGLQSALFPTSSQAKFRTLAEIGITTNPKSGELQMDDGKVRASLTDDYDAVANLFIRTRSGEGVGERIATQIKQYRDPASGVVRSRIRGLESIIKNQDKEIEQRERQAEDRQVAIKRRFANLESQLNGLNAQGSFLAQRFGGGGEGGGGGGNG